MTVLVGALCTDDVVIGSDGIATFASGVQPLLQLQTDSKISIIDGSVILASTGAVGLAQRLKHHAEQAVQGQVFKNLAWHEATTNLSKRFLSDCQSSHVQMHPQHGLRFGALVAACIKGQPYLVEYASTDFQPELKQDQLFFVSMGSGQQLAEPFLAFVSKVLWKNTKPTVEVAKFGVYWALDHACRLAPGGVGYPITISALPLSNGTWSASKLEDLQLQEAAQYVSELEDYIGNFALKKITEAPSEPVPTPDKK